MGETLKNTKVKANKSSFNDEDMLNDVLISFKHLVSSYATALNEASNKEIYNLFYTVFSNASKIQASLFSTAFKLGWYQLECADQVKIDKVYNKFNSNLNQI